MKLQMKIKRGWKILRHRLYEESRRYDKPKFAGLSWYAEPPSEYYFDHWTRRPPGAGPLTVFRTRDQAKNYMRHIVRHWLRGNERIFAVPCHYLPSKARKIWYATRYEKLGRDRLAPHTIFADSIRVLPKNALVLGFRVLFVEPVTSMRIPVGTTSAVPVSAGMFFDNGEIFVKIDKE